VYLGFFCILGLFFSQSTSKNIKGFVDLSASYFLEIGSLKKLTLLVLIINKD